MIRASVTMRGLCSAAALVFGCTGPVWVGPARGEYAVGCITEATGPIAGAGVSYYRGAQLAVEEINASGWIGQGVKLKLKEKESGSDAARAVQALTQFAADRSVLAVSIFLFLPLSAPPTPRTL